MKNPELCERPYCRQPYTKVVQGYYNRGDRRWMLQVCDEHAKPYEDTPKDSLGNLASVQPRAELT